MEDSRRNTVQFDLAFVKVDEEKVLTVFDNASTTTLLLRDLVKSGKIDVVHTTDTSKVKGIGGGANAEMVEILLHTKDRKKSARITAAVVDEIMTMHPRNKKSFEQVTQLSVNALN